MSLGIMIVGGIVIVSVVGVLGEVLKAALSRKAARVPVAGMEELARRLALLESRLEERDGAVLKLQEELRFVSRMLEDKTAR